MFSWFLSFDERIMIDSIYRKESDSMEASREAYLERITLKKLQPSHQPIRLCEYDSSWPTTYKKEEARIKIQLNHEICLIEHVGSTSIPGLCAKPILDILLLVKDSSKEAQYVDALASIGYELIMREEEWYAHRLLRKSEPAVNLHVFSDGCEEAKRMLAFRDWLRVHEGDLRLYGDTKRELSQKKWKYVQEYADAKSEVVATIISHINEHKS